MERLKSFLSRPRNAVLVLALVAGVAGGATYAAASRSSSSGGSGDTLQFLNGLVFAGVYAFIFWATGTAGWLFGALLGVVQALFVGSALV
jgi:hypothetical protein